MKLTLEHFLGHWRLSREIRHVDGAGATFNGSASWTMQGARALYVETGALHIKQAPPMLAERRYFWDADLNVFFDDGRAFHTVPYQGGKTRHDCPPDTYDVTYDFGQWPAFSMCWHVVGPRKNYVSESQYVR